MPTILTESELLHYFPSFPEKFKTRLREFLAGKNVVLTEDEFNFATASVSQFTQEVLRVTAKIPFGETMTYLQLANALGKPKAVRAVASALGRNPLPFVIPCHRVTATNGIGGFAFGVPLKMKLLVFEKERRQLNSR